jgi:Rieske 2Fe-2S family protein
LKQTIEELIETHRPGFSMAQDFYTSQEIFEEDLKRIFFRHWLFVGHVSRLPEIGNFFTVELGNESIIIIRGDKMELHALWNVCRHRGSRICLESEGTARSLVCPYHQWVYRSDGTLLNARLMQETFEAAEHGLTRAHVRAVEGMIFVSMADLPPEFEPFRKGIESRLRPHDLGSAKICHRQLYEIAANWKLVVENSRECYHCGVAHPQYCKAIGFAAAIGSAALQAESALIEEQRMRAVKELGLEVEPIPFISNSWHHYRRFFLRPGFETESIDGRPVAPVMGSLPNCDTGVFAVVTLPNMLLEANRDYVMTLRLLPKGPQLTEAEVCWLVREDAQEGADYDVDRVTEFWRLTSEQDWKLCENNQSGVNSSRYCPGPYGPTEEGVKHFGHWYIEELKTGGRAHGKS